MNGDILEIKDQLVVTLMAGGFIPHFVAPDGDGAMEPAHTQAFERYENDEPDLESIVQKLTGDRPLLGVPWADLLHLMKSARSQRCGHVYRDSFCKTGIFYCSPFQTIILAQENLWSI
jgi:hypothetical protein